MINVGATVALVVGVLLGIAVLWLIRYVLTLRRVVPTNMVHIVQTGNKTVPYGRGRDAGNTYYAWPAWLPIWGVDFTIFPESIFKVNLSDYDAYDNVRLPFMVDVTAFFRVDDASTVAQRVSSFGELDDQLRDVLQGSVRRILATSELEAIMQERASFGDQFTREVGDQIKEWGVVPVKTIEFMDIRDCKGSQVIDNIMAKEKSRIDRESRIVVAENSREAELKEIDAARIVDVQKQDALQQIGERTAQKDKAVGIAMEQSKQEVQEQAKITADKDMAVREVEIVRLAQITREAAVTKANEDREVVEQQALAQKAKAERESEAQLYAAERNASGIRLEGAAKAESEKLMLMAPVDTQITLAKEIGDNEGYQKYLIDVRQIEATQDVGVKMAEALKDADLKIIANAGDIQTGITNLTDILSAKGGLNIGSMLESLKNTEQGGKLVDKLVGTTST